MCMHVCICIFTRVWICVYTCTCMMYINYGMYVVRNMGIVYYTQHVLTYIDIRNCHKQF